MKAFSRYEIGLLFMSVSLGAGFLTSGMHFVGSTNLIDSGRSRAPTAVPAAASVLAQPIEDGEECQLEVAAASRLFRDQVLGAQENVAMVCLLVGSNSRNEREKIFRTLSRTQQQHVFERLQTFPASEDRDGLLKFVSFSLTDGDFARGMNFISTVVDPTLQRTLALDWIMNLVPANNGDEATARWLVDNGSRYLDEKETRAALAGVIRNWGGREPRAAMQFTDRLDPDEETLAALADVVSSVCMMWSKGGCSKKTCNGLPSRVRHRRTPQAAQWANTLPADAARSTAWELVVGLWAFYEPAAAKDWLHSLPTGADRNAAMTAYDKAIVEHAQFVYSGNPGGTLDFLQTNLLDPALATAQIQTLLARWAATADPVFPAKWAAAHGVPMPAVERIPR